MRQDRRSSLPASARAALATVAVATRVAAGVPSVPATAGGVVIVKETETRFRLAQDSAAADSVIRAVLFYSPTCPHCEFVINRHLPLFFGVYGGEPRGVRDGDFLLLTNGRLEILLVDASQPEGNGLYTESLDRVPGNFGVPRLVMGDSVLIGSRDIPGRFHLLARAALARGGSRWPEIPGLDSVIARLPARRLAAKERSASDTGGPATRGAPDSAAPEIREGLAGAPTQPEPEARRLPAPVQAPAAGPSDRTGPNDSAPRAGAAPSVAAPGAIRQADATDSTTTTAVALERLTRPSVAERFRRDLAGNSLSVLVLLAMAAAIAATPWRIRATGDRPTLGLAVPTVAVVGMGVATYLTYIEASGATAVCGPVGDCNTVQQSPYAVLFGILPVGALGLVGYVAIIVAWLLARYGAARVATRATLAVCAMALGGTVFSIYLTALEPFVIGATCAWCLTSAAAISLVYWLSVPPAAAASRRRPIA